MRILFLHGWHSIPGGVKPTHLENRHHTVINPALDDDDFGAAVCTAQAEYDQHPPDVIVGSSSGSAVDTSIASGFPATIMPPRTKELATTALCDASGDEIWRGVGICVGEKGGYTVGCSELEMAR